MRDHCPPLLPLLVPLAAAGCDSAAAEAYVRSAQADIRKPVAQVSIGKNSVGEDCTQQAEAQSADVFCGTWQQPSARVRSGGPGNSRAILRSSPPPASGAPASTAGSAASRRSPPPSSAAIRPN